MNRYLLIGLLLLPVGVRAQKSWTLQAAKDTALARNYGVAIARNEAEIAKMSSGYGQAGMLPVVDVNAAYAKSVNDIRQETSNGTITENSGVGSTATTGKVALSWTLFDGGKMFASYDRLKQLEAIGEWNAKRAIADLNAQVTVAYAKLAYQQMLLASIQNSLRYFQERSGIAAKKFEIGNAAKTELLSSNVDFLARQNEALQVESNLRMTILEFNTLLHLSLTDSAIATDSLVLPVLPPYADCLSAVETSNIDVQTAALRVQVARDNYREMRGDYFPVLSLDAAYAYTKTVTEKGFFLENRSQGPASGISLKWRIFDGFSQNRAARISKMQTENARLEQEQIRLDMQSAVAQAWQKLLTSNALAKAERDAEDQARQNLDIMAARFRLNESTSLEWKDAERTWESARQRYLAALYTAQIAYAELTFLTGIKQ